MTVVRIGTVPQSHIKIVVSGGCERRADRAAHRPFHDAATFIKLDDAGGRYGRPYAVTCYGLGSVRGVGGVAGKGDLKAVRVP
jgi:hypothetical protein